MKQGKKRNQTKRNKNKTDGNETCFFFGWIAEHYHNNQQYAQFWLAGKVIPAVWNFHYSLLIHARAPSTIHLLHPVILQYQMLARVCQLNDDSDNTFQRFCWILYNVDFCVCVWSMNFREMYMCACALMNMDHLLLCEAMSRTRE